MGEAALWWDAAGYNPWSLAWGNFTSSFLLRFSLLDPPPLHVLIFDPVMAMHYDTLNRTISKWRILEGESMLNYADRFERDILG